MTKKDMLDTMFDEYVSRKNLYNDLITLANLHEKDSEEYIHYLKAATMEWHAANVLEQVANKMFPNSNLFDMYLDTL